MLIKHQKDFWSGLMFIILGAGFALIAQEKYSMGTTARMGPGYFPFILGILLTILGAVVALSALRGEYSEEDRIGHFDWDIIILVVGSIAFFALSLDHLGIYLSVAILVLLSSLASHEFSLKIALLNAFFLIGFAYLTFIKGLGLVFPTTPLPWNEWETHAQIIIPIVLIAGLALLIMKSKNRKGV